MQLRDVVFATVGLAAVASALNNGLGRLPGMGWNSDYCVACSAADRQRLGVPELGGFENQDFLQHIADVIQDKWAHLGYEYVNCDSLWDAKTRLPNGSLTHNPVSFPNGLTPVVSYIHDKGLGFGVYGDRGPKDCNGNPGQYGHETEDAQYFARIGVDWYKSDSCSAPSDLASTIAEYTKIGAALNATGRPIWYALCSWHPDIAPPPGGMQIANSFRTGPDTVCGWSCVMENVKNALPIAKYSGASAHGGGHIDMCLLLSENWGKGADVMSQPRMRSQFNLWSVMGSNMLMTGNLSALPPWTLETWSNAAVIQVNQDPGQHPFFEVTPDSHARTQPLMSRYRLFTRLGDPPAALFECGGEPALQTWQTDAPFRHALHNTKAGQCLNVADCASALIYDSCTQDGCHIGSYSNEAFNFTDAGTLVALLNGRCVTAASDADIHLADCQSPPPASQKWTFDATTGQVVNQGKCLTAGDPTPVTEGTLVIARPVVGGVAVLFLNNHPDALNITCGTNCMAALGFKSATQTVTATDLWSGAVVHTSPATGLNVSVAENGASRFFKFSAVGAAAVVVE